MSCQDDTNDRPYIYECCPESIDGITAQYLIDLWKERDIENYHIYCCKCRKIYHIFKLGLKWTGYIATDEQLKDYKEQEANFMLRREEKEHKVEVVFTLTDITKFRCIVCKQGMFETEPLEIKEKFLDDLNMTVGVLLNKYTTPTKEQYIAEWNICKGIVNSCRRCTEIAQKRMNSGKYN